MRSYEDIISDLNVVKEALIPIKEMYDAEIKKVRYFEDELLKFKLDNRMFRPMSDLKEYAGKELSSIELVVQEEDGTLNVEHMYNDDMFDITEDGYLDYSSYNYGVMSYNKEKDVYEYFYHYSCEEKKFVGFLEIEFYDYDDDDEE